VTRELRFKEDLLRVTDVTMLPVYVTPGLIEKPVEVLIGLNSGVKSLFVFFLIPPPVLANASATTPTSDRETIDFLSMWLNFSVKVTCIADKNIKLFGKFLTLFRISLVMS
jgi:hypothetical protein